MSIIYNVTIEPTKEEDRFAITWENTATLSRASFTRTAPLTAEEMQYLWQHPWNYLDTGEKFFQFLNGDAHYFNEALDHAFKQADILHLRLSTCKQTANWPFELLAHDNFFLLPHRVHLVRRVSDRGANNEMTPPNRPLKLLFMACSPLDEHAELDFEREEEAIFHITGNLAIDM
ncbi:MAG TPA: hypothetical protein VK469_20020, partial [Candidatus Kapabacteria bacterium]|nr:hypothetical protein [Candidatus Kapabacteria bacterium]